MDFLPLTYTRPIAACIVGINTIADKWAAHLVSTPVILTEGYLRVKYPLPATSTDTCYINSSLIPDSTLIEAIHSLSDGQSLTQGDTLLAYRSAQAGITYDTIETLAISASVIPYIQPFIQIKSPADLFRLNGAVMVQDFARLTAGRQSQALSPSNTLIGDPPQLFIESGATIEGAILNTKSGPIYIAADAEIMEGSLIRGPFALGTHAFVKMGAKIYGPTTIGPYCKVGGEISNSIFFGYSNKGHDGFVGDSVIGEWCNLGADTNTSNLKNNYGSVDVWSYRESKNMDTGLQFHGLIMGDHAKCGINTMFNTGSVVGVSANVFGSDFPPKFIPSFSWGGAQWLRTFTFDKAIEVATRMMERRGLPLTQIDMDILREAYTRDEKYRKQ
jgi:UDP-N-acetylglucosamine diphosphorylase/glucosamine-1-phosphate N-acetyltransferase